MLSKFSKSFFPNKFITSASSSFSQYIPRPHSAEHLKLQLKLFNFEKINTEVKTLPTGTKLVGLNINPAEPRFLGTQPFYNPEILNALSPSEKEAWMEIAKEYYGQIGQYELLCDVKCVTSHSNNGIPIHHINPELLEVQSYTPVEEILGLDIEYMMKR
ncbi:hypothetical protein EP47_01405 [Legionella norrlandica]|uniref:Uncharacterized protein n=1 Tax=Legionella norrlandica TaxID=1498499 RepID=A0A0A2T4B2_9GAMM|nr:hypothetical protein [Legionella norrlandica]KGP62263.1 hypothetical protein EP47_01405 [Legionella norrlandica]